MAVLASPIMMTVMKSMVRRPYLSPKWPKMAPPMGRNRKPTANEPMEASSPATWLSEGKNNGPNTTAAAVP